MGAHYTKPQGTMSSKDWLEMKRLWWVCLVRDRLIALGYRRPLQISEENLQVELDINLSDEFRDEFCRTEVHLPRVRDALFFVFLSFCRLCIPLTRILKLDVDKLNCHLALQEAGECVKSLESWLKMTNDNMQASYDDIRSNELVVLNYQLLQIYFQLVLLARLSKQSS